VVTGHDGDDGGGEPGLDEGVVVGAHLSETLGVLVDEGGLGDGVGAGEVLVDEEGVFVVGLAHALGLAGGVVGPVGGHGGVADGEEEDLDGVGETDVVGLVGVLEGVERLDGSCLDLLNKNITRGTGHALPLVVGDDGVVGPHLHGGELGEGGSKIGEDGDTGDDDGLVGVEEGDVVPGHEELVVVADGELNAHVVVGKGGGGEGHTRVPGVEEGEGEVEHLLGKGLAGGDKIVRHSNHVEVPDLLSGGGGEGRPEIELVVVEASGDKIVESNGGLTDEVVHEIRSPGHIGINGHITSVLLGRVGGDGRHRRKDEAHPGVQEVITGTGDAYRPLLRESGGTGSTAKNNGNLSEPGGLAGLAHKVRGSIVTTVHIFLKLIVCCEINETRGQIGSDDRHFCFFLFIGSKKKKIRVKKKNFFFSG